MQVLLNFVCKVDKLQSDTEGIPEAMAEALLIFFHSLFQPVSSSRSPHWEENTGT
jgi:hypothetical protein